MASYLALMGSGTAGADASNPSMLTMGSKTVFAHGIPIAFMAVPIVPHIRVKVPHPGIVAMGSFNVFVHGLPVARVGDSITCGDIILTGSPDILVG